jgi:hypothetical protein
MLIRFLATPTNMVIYLGYGRASVPYITTRLSEALPE